MFRTFVKVRHASVLADTYQLCNDSSTNTNPRLSIRCWSGGCCFISLCSAICGVSVIIRKSAMSRPLVFCSSMATVVVLSVNRSSQKKHCRSVKSGSFSSECTQVTRLCGSLMRCPVLSSYFIILPVRTFPLISICQKIVEPPHFFEVPTLYKANSRSVSSLPKTVEMYRYKGLTE